MASALAASGVAERIDEVPEFRWRVLTGADPIRPALLGLADADLCQDRVADVGWLSRCHLRRLGKQSLCRGSHPGGVRRRELLRMDFCARPRDPNVALLEVDPLVYGRNAACLPDLDLHGGGLPSILTARRLGKPRVGCRGVGWRHHAS